MIPPLRRCLSDKQNTLQPQMKQKFEGVIQMLQFLARMPGLVLFYLMFLDVPEAAFTVTLYCLCQCML